MDYDHFLVDNIQLYIEGNSIEIKSPYLKALNAFVLGAQAYVFTDLESFKKHLLEAKAIFIELTGHEEKPALCYNDLELVAGKQGNLNVCFDNLN